MLKNILAGAAVVTVAGLGYATYRHQRNKNLNKVAVEAVDTALKGVREDLAKPAQVKPATLKETFDQTFNTITTMIQFDKSWLNGTGYLNGAMDVKLKEGEVAKSIDCHGRRVILVGTKHKTAVLFERYTQGHGAFVIVHNSSKELRDVLPNGNLDLDQFKAFLKTVGI